MDKTGLTKNDCWVLSDSWIGFWQSVIKTKYGKKVFCIKCNKEIPLNKIGPHCATMYGTHGEIK